MCHGGLIVFRCYLRNKTHLVKAVLRKPCLHYCHPPKKLLRAAASTPGQTQQYGSTKHGLIHTRCSHVDCCPDCDPRQEVVLRRRDPRSCALSSKCKKGLLFIFFQMCFSKSVFLSLFSISATSFFLCCLATGLPDGAFSGAVMTASVCGC